jgi:hypothetical protein
MKADLHINEPRMAQMTTAILDDMIRGRWKKGTHSGIIQVPFAD